MAYPYISLVASLPKEVCVAVAVRLAFREAADADDDRVVATATVVINPDRTSRVKVAKKVQ